MYNSLDGGDSRRRTDDSDEYDDGFGDDDDVFEEDAIDEFYGFTVEDEDEGFDE